ncbi:MAG: VacJ family lipoprotein [Gammaproteobacteria bacterium]|nr:VacJ family lipoprotein [Gammaproteobacteria bacterium]
MKVPYLLYRMLLIATVAIMLSACAGQGETRSEPHPDDPWEGFNRGVWTFNRSLDKAIMRPAAQAYHYVTPNFLEQGISNVVDNFRYPTTIVNLLLQGKFKEFGISIGRLLLNTTFGLGGLVDVATIEGVPKYEEDFGQTFATWGWKESPYLMLPFFGPSTIRDGIGLVPELYSDGISTTLRESDAFWPLPVSLVSDRTNLLKRDEDIDNAADDYLLVRDAWLQNRRYKISDGNNELPDYEFFLEEGDAPEDESN